MLLYIDYDYVQHISAPPLVLSSAKIIALLGVWYSLQLAVDLTRKHEAHIGMGYQPTISRAGLGSKAAAEAAAKSVVEPSFAVWAH